MRIGPINIEWCSISYGWHLHKWTYYNQSSWRHGVVYLGRLKIVW